MKLSANARMHVTNEITRALGDEYDAARKAVKQADDARQAKWDAFAADMESVLNKAQYEIHALVRRHKLTQLEGRGIVVRALNERYAPEGISCRQFEQTDVDFNAGLRAARQRMSEVEDMVKRAVSKALFEIEINGRRATIDSIVADVIREIKAGR